MSPKPQTTRTRIHGVLTQPGMQIIFVDLPGMHANQTRAMNRYMNRTALSSLADSDVNLFLVEALRWTDEDERVLGDLKAAGRPILLLINKVDRAHPKERLFPYIDDLSAKAEFAEIVPISAYAQVESRQAARPHRAPPAGVAGPVSGRTRDRLAGRVHGRRDRPREAHAAVAGGVAVRPRRRDRGHGTVRGRTRQARGAGRDLGRTHGPEGRS